MPGHYGATNTMLAAEVGAANLVQLSNLERTTTVLAEDVVQAAFDYADEIIDGEFSVSGYLIPLGFSDARDYRAVRRWEIDLALAKLKRLRPPKEGEPSLEEMAELVRQRIREYTGGLKKFYTAPTRGTLQDRPSAPVALDGRGGAGVAPQYEWRGSQGFVRIR
jgi:hypothetical protein